MVDDMIEEEMQIAGEQDGAHSKTLSSKTFEEPLEELRMPPCVSVDTTASIAEVIGLMQKKKIGSVLVVDGGALTGIVTERDILMKVVGVIKDFEGTTVADIMTHDPLALMPGDMIAYVMNNMHVGGYRHVPIVNKDREPISIISIKDVMSFILDHFPEEITNITGEPYRGPISREGA